MTERERGIRKARRTARDVHKRYGVLTAGDIKLEAIAAAMGVGIVEGTLQGSRARLSGGRKPVIRISDGTPLDGARRFSIAHELAHYVLKHPLACVDGTCAVADKKATRDRSERDYEVEANVFATELLMPRRLLAQRCATATPSLDIVRAIAGDFMTSVPASAIRFVELTPERCAAIYSENGKVLWAPSSPKLKTKIPRGKDVDRASVAFECSGKPLIEDRSRSVAANIWFETPEKVEIVEHSAAIPEVGGVITLLWVPEAAATSLGMRSVDLRSRTKKDRTN